MMPSEHCAECGVKLTPEEQLMFLDVCHGCECAMWLGSDWLEEMTNEHGRPAD